MKKILIIGHSHIHALQKAGIDDEIFEFHQANGIEISALREINGDNYNSVVLLIDGNYHNIFGLVNLPEQFDFYLPDRIDLPVKTNVQLLPVSLVHKIFERDMRFVLSFTSQLSQLFKNNIIYQIESPPPLPESHIIKYPDPFKEKIDQLGISSAVFRYKLWRLHSKIVHKHCETIGITFIDIPKETQDTDGILLEKYCHFDATHTNALYGSLVLNQIRVINNMDTKEVSI